MGFIGSVIMFMLCDEYNIHSLYWKMLLIISLAIGIILFAISFIFKITPVSVLLRTLCMGVMVATPTLILSAIAGLSYFVTVSDSIRLSLLIAIFVAVVFSCAMVLASYKQRVKDRYFIEREFLFEADRIVIRQPLKTNLDPAPISDETFFGKIYHKFGLYLIIGIPLAYPIQRLLSDTGGTAAVLLLLSILGLPLTIYILGRMTCGAYLWIYKVWQLERQHGKPVVYQVTE